MSQHKAFRGRLTNAERVEIYTLYSEGKLIVGDNSYSNCVKLVYSDDPTFESATMCKKCTSFFAVSSDSRSTLL